MNITKLEKKRDFWGKCLLTVHDMSITNCF